MLQSPSDNSSGEFFESWQALDAEVIVDAIQRNKLEKPLHLTGVDPTEEDVETILAEVAEEIPNHGLTLADFEL